ncbi:DUF4890 domain-containing protein [uncultured Algibacter sp.]|uniref:DUF4890 domain-containing protein n=1 Tax=uncultured Algibacter sp. TaxID=298659 RepID=UPI002630F0C1|nr:DUF4890 domain-containing protein [uncultured Algibacter sp.]
MKKLVLIIVALLAIQVGAQEPKRDGHKKGQAMKNLSAEEIANLKTKKMTLHLELNESQQKEIYDINLANATTRKAHMESRKAKKESGDAQKPSKEDRLKMANALLDHKIAMKAKMKEILNEEQFAKWEKAQARANAKQKGKKKPHKKKKQE